MSPWLVAALVWCLGANVIAMVPMRDHHWRAAYGLMALGLPILVGLWTQVSWFWALAFLVAAGSILRWPVYFLTRWLRTRVSR